MGIELSLFVIFLAHIKGMFETIKALYYFFLIINYFFLEISKC